MSWQMLKTPSSLRNYLNLVSFILGAQMQRGMVTPYLF